MYAANPPPPYYANIQGAYPPPYHQPPPYPTKYKKKSGGSSCCRCICCCCCFFFFLIPFTFLVFFALYKVYDPKLPVYKVEDLQVKAFAIQPDLSVNTELEIRLRAENPNHLIGFIYGDNNWINVSYMDVSICSGKVPGFYQPHENTTVVKMDLKGKSKFDSHMQHTFNDSRTKHFIPLVVELRVPVSIILAETNQLREIRAFVNSSIVVDNFTPNTKVGILSKDTHVHFEM